MKLVIWLTLIFPFTIQAQAVGGYAPDGKFVYITPVGVDFYTLGCAYNPPNEITCADGKIYTLSGKTIESAIRENLKETVPSIMTSPRNPSKKAIDQ